MLRFLLLPALFVIFSIFHACENKKDSIWIIEDFLAKNRSDIVFSTFFQDFKAVSYAKTCTFEGLIRLIRNISASDEYVFCKGM